MSKEKKYLSSRQLYFLPHVHKFNQNEVKKSTRLEHSPNSFRPIEKIILDKSLLDKKSCEASLQLESHKKVKSSLNLYNKYQLLPKLMSKKQRERERERKSGSKEEEISAQRKGVQNRKKIALVAVKQVEGVKQSLLTFEVSPYHKRFRYNLENDVLNMPFKLSNNYSQHSLLISKGITDQLMIRPVQTKYTRLMTQVDENSCSKSLERVPDFLLKLVSSQKTISN